MTQPLLEVSGLEVAYGPIRAVRGVSLEVAGGEVVALIGANGAGKTTTLRTIAGLLRPTSGAIRYEGVSIAGQRPHRLARRGLVLVPEGRGVLSRLTVLENLLLGAAGRRDRRDVRADLEQVYARFPRLVERQNQLGGTLSGGEQQMLAIGRALMSRPRLLMLDEPSLGLAPLVVRDIFGVVADLKAAGVTILLVEQKARAALEVADRAYVLETGRVALSGPSSELLASERVIRAYLGELVDAPSAL
jgi:branched-chain amino acid transport system ATP-binding protein